MAHIKSRDLIISENYEIATFLGWKALGKGKLTNFMLPEVLYTYDNEGREEQLCDTEDMKFQTSADWLFLVVDHINALGYRTELRERTNIHKFKIDSPVENVVTRMSQNSRIEVLLDGILEFIDWHKEKFF